MDYVRKENESDQELIYRICKDKELIGSWNDVAKILNELLNCDYTESKYRKEYQMFEKMFNANKDSILDADKYIKELQLQEERLRKERVKLQTMNIERNRIDRNEARRELYYEQVGSVCNALPLPDFKEIISFNNEIEYMVCIADIHYGSEFESINNAYSPSICKHRFNILLDKLKVFIEQHNVQTLTVVGLGDFIQGILRLSDLKINDTSVVQATVEVSRLMGSFLNELSKYVNVKYYHTPTANHTQLRVLGANAGELCDEDVEYIIGNYIKDLCRNNNRIEVILSESSLGYIDIDSISGFNIIAMHGHRIKDVKTAVKDISMLTGSIVDYLVIGHMHNNLEQSVSENECYDIEVLGCPSFVGSDPYADSIFKGGKAAVKIFGFDKVYGHTESYKIILN